MANIDDDYPYFDVAEARRAARRMAQAAGVSADAEEEIASLAGRTAADRCVTIGEIKSFIADRL